MHIPRLLVNSVAKSRICIFLVLEKGALFILNENISVNWKFEIREIPLETKHHNSARFSKQRHYYIRSLDKIYYTPGRVRKQKRQHPDIGKKSTPKQFNILLLSGWPE
jgi:hypothetical protein